MCTCIVCMYVCVMVCRMPFSTSESDAICSLSPGLRCPSTSRPCVCVCICVYMYVCMYVLKYGECPLLLLSLIRFGHFHRGCADHGLQDPVCMCVCCIYGFIPYRYIHTYMHTYIHNTYVHTLKSISLSPSPRR